MINEEKKESLLEKKDKSAFKSWKTYAIASGVIVIGTGVGVGIYYGVNANNNSGVVNLSEQDISNAIAKTNFTLPVSMATKANTISPEITADFIQKQLTGQFKTAFKASSFTHEEQVMVQEPEQQLSSTHELNDSDLATIGTINVKIKYNYGEIKGQELNLKINISISDQQMVDAIAGGTYELNDIVINTKADFIYSNVKALVEDQLDGDYKKTFQDNIDNFKVNTIMIGDNKLSDKDLQVTGSINGVINYNYGEIKGQELNLKINISISDQQMVDAIAGGTYELNDIVINTKADFIYSNVKALVEDQLDGDYKKTFQDNIDNFKVNTIMIGDNKLSDKDLQVTGPINGVINYNYGEKTGEASLTINVTIPTVQDIWQKIKDTKFKITVNSGISDAEIKELDHQVPTFVQNQLPDLYKEYFDSKLFTSSRICKKINDAMVPINNNDLKEPNTTKTFWIWFDYSSDGKGKLGDAEIEITLI